MNKIKTLLVISISAIILSGCGQFKSLPKEERYKPINDLAAEIDYQSTGEVISEEYGGGDGVFGSSVLKVEVSGETAFVDLIENVKAVTEMRDCSQSKNNLTAITNLLL